jgi:CubicO group peptidase (beta-lactamase class C family)
MLSRCIVASLALAALAPVASAQCEFADLNSFDFGVPFVPQSLDTFGRELAMDGDVLAVAAPGNDEPGLADVGGVYVYRYDGAAYQAEQFLLPAGAAANAYVGYTTLLSGDTLLTRLGDQMAEFVFDGQAWNETTPIDLSSWTAPSGDDAFDGDVLLIGRIGQFSGSGEAVVSPLDSLTTEAPAMLSGGGGLWGTASDYLRFTHFLLGRGELEGTRLLGSRTVDYMARNHLPGNVDLEQFGRPLFAETSYDGVGFGLGFSVQLDPAAYRVLSSPGEYAWGGAASTAFWCDPHEDIAVVFLTQLLPSSTHPIRTQLKQLVYQALVD